MKFREFRWKTYFNQRNRKKERNKEEERGEKGGGGREREYILRRSRR